MTTFVVGWDGDVNVLRWRVGIAQCDHGDVDVRRFPDSLSVGTGIRHDDEARFLEGASDVVGEATGREATSYGNCTSMSSKLEHGSLPVRSSGDDTDVCRIVDRNDNSRCKDNLFPVNRF